MSTRIPPLIVVKVVTVAMAHLKVSSEVSAPNLRGRSPNFRGHGFEQGCPLGRYILRRFAHSWCPSCCMLTMTGTFEHV